MPQLFFMKNLHIIKVTSSGCWPQSRLRGSYVNVPVGKPLSNLSWPLFPAVGYSVTQGSVLDHLLFSPKCVPCHAVTFHLFADSFKTMLRPFLWVPLPWYQLSASLVYHYLRLHIVWTHYPFPSSSDFFLSSHAVNFPNLKYFGVFLGSIGV
jgi:hypothetical protein